MKVIRVLAIAAIAVSVGGGFVQAQNISDKQVPAEFPPSSYQGRQYVDSNGCVFIRAGVDGNVSWIPRVTRSRKVLCGFQPTLAQAKPAAKPKPAAAPAQTKTSKASKAVAAKPALTARTTQPKHKPMRVASSDRQAAVAMAPQRSVQPQKTQATTAAPVKTTQVARTTQPARTTQVPPVRGTVSSCQGGSAISSRYIGSEDARCGPQATPHVTYVQGGGGSGALTRPAGVIPVAPMPSHASDGSHAVPRVYSQSVPGAYGTVPQSGRVAPRHVYESQQNTKGTYIPAGYKPVWEDDRLNPLRAHQTFQGKEQMEIVWSKTVPRYLIDRNTGRDISYKYPGLQYPYTSFEQQRAAGVTISTRGNVTPEPVRVTRGMPRKASIQQAPRAVIATRSTTPEKTASHRYIQIGVFANREHAQSAAQKIAARGLPARLANMTRGGQSYTVMTTGPFRTQSDLQTALDRVRSAGFSNARLRN